jgi:hypothetical protein
MPVLDTWHRSVPVSLLAPQAEQQGTDMGDMGAATRSGPWSDAWRLCARCSYCHAALSPDGAAFTPLFRGARIKGTVRLMSVTRCNSTHGAVRCAVAPLTSQCPDTINTVCEVYTRSAKLSVNFYYSKKYGGSSQS